MKIVLALIMLVAFSGLVSAQDFQIVDVEINGMDMTGVNSVQVELGEDTDIRVEVEGLNDTDDVRIKAWLGGYEYGDIEDSSEIFDIEAGVTYSETLHLNIPEDLDVDDNEFTLYVEVYDDEETVIATYDVYVEQQRHSLEIMDVIYNTILEDGDVVEVRVENHAENKEEDIKVTLTIDDFTVSGYIDELAAAPEDSNEDEEDSDSISFILDLDDLTTGYYDMEVDVSYNRGHDNVEHVYAVYVLTDEAVPETAPEEPASDDEGTVIVTVSGSGLEYELTFVNTQSESEVFTIDIAGEDQWATVDMNPLVVVGADDTAVVELVLNPLDENCCVETEFTIQILDSDGMLLEEATFEVDVDNKGNWWADNWWKLVAIILVVLIVLIILILIFKGAGSDDDDDLELQEGKTYY